MGFKVRTGDRFEDKDPRSGERVIRILEKGSLSRRHRYVVVVSERNPQTVGRKGWITTRTLDRFYNRVSH